MNNTTSKAAILKNREEFILGGGLGASLKSVKVTDVDLNNKFCEEEIFDDTPPRVNIVTDIKILAKLEISYDAGYEIFINTMHLSPLYKDPILSVDHLIDIIENNDFTFDLSDLIEPENITIIFQEQAALDAAEDNNMGDIESYRDFDDLGWLNFDEYEAQKAVDQYQEILNSRGSEKRQPITDQVKDEITAQIKSQAIALLRRAQ